MYSFIINPNARSGKGLRAWKLIEHRLEEKSVPYQVFFTKYQGHATQIARTLTQEKDCRSLIVLGGDGTLNEAVNGIADLARVTLGYIPIGSSNEDLLVGDVVFLKIPRPRLKIPCPFLNIPAGLW